MNYKFFRNISTFLLCFILMFSSLSLISCQSNELEYYVTVEELVEEAPFDFLLPTAVPDNYDFTRAWSVGKTINMEYTNGNFEIVYSTVKGEGKRSEDPIQFDVVTEETIGGLSVTMKEYINFPVRLCLALFDMNGFSCAFDSVSAEELEIFISGLKLSSEVTDLSSASGKTAISYSSLSELEAATGLTLPLPDESTLGGWKAVEYFSIDDEAAVVRYELGDDSLYYGTSADSKIIKAYNVYPNFSDSFMFYNVDENENYYSFRGLSSNGTATVNMISMVSWTGKDVAGQEYMINCYDGISEEDMIELVGNFTVPTTGGKPIKAEQPEDTAEARE